MPKIDWSQIKPIPGFDSLQWKREVQAKIYEETKNMTFAEQRERRRRIVEESDKRRAALATRIESGDPTLPAFIVR